MLHAALFLILSCLLAVGFVGAFQMEDLGVGCQRDHTHCDRKGFRDVNGLTTFVNDMRAKYPALTRVFSIGRSEEGREIYVLEISDSPGNLTEFEPNIKMIANLHGDENVGTNILIQYISYVLEKYETDQRVKRIVDSMHTFFALTVNPDGYHACTRENIKKLDLNRNFPDRHRNGSYYTNRARETINLMNWIAHSETKFLLSTNYHGGAYVVNYPFDAGEGQGAQYCDDNDLFIDISKSYAKTNPSIMKGGFKDGITNGKDWYPVYGGMQDFNYIWGGCMELTLEVSCDKWPQYIEKDYRQYFDENLESILSFSEFALSGVRGHILGAEGEVVKNGRVQLVGRKHMLVHSDAVTGKYFRLVPQGTHRLKATAEGYLHAEKEFTYTGGVVVVDFVLTKDPLHPVPSNYDGTIFIWVIVLCALGLIARVYVIRYWRGRQSPVHLGSV